MSKKVSYPRISQQFAVSIIHISENIHNGMLKFVNHSTPLKWVSDDCVDGVTYAYKACLEEGTNQF